MPLTFGSLFSGVGGFDMGFESAGVSCAWQCEIDPQASAVLARHWPGVPRFADVRLLTKKHLTPVDVLVGGFPCQDLSVAGKRTGLKGERSGLFYELLRVARLVRPRLLVWENVPGLLSSDDGRDFARVLRGLADIGYFGSWRVLDAQHFGVPQRRRRVFGVFARGRLGVECCCQILALGEGVRRHPAKGQEAEQGVAGQFGGGSDGRGRNADTDRMTFIREVAHSCRTQDQRVGNGWNSNMVPTAPRHVADTLSVDANQTFGFAGEAVARCLTSRNGRIDGEGETFVVGPLMGGGTPAVPCPAGVNNQAVASGHIIAIQDTTGIQGVFTPVSVNENQRVTVFETDVTAPLNAAGGKPGQGYSAVREESGVRRLTPRECERLMGWPDDWTRWAADGAEFADGPRYRMCGNGVVGPVAGWLGRRIVSHTQEG